MSPRSSILRFAAAILAFFALLLPSLASAGARQPNRERTRERSGTPTAGAGERAESPKAGAAAANLPKPSPAQQANLQQLRNDLAAMGQGAQSAEAEIRELAQDLQGMALQPPDPALVQDLATSLSAAVADSSLSPQEMAQLTQAVYGVLNSAGLDQQEIAVLKNDAEAILSASGVGQAEVQAVVDDLQAIYDAYQGGGKSSRARRSPRGR